MRKVYNKCYAQQIILTTVIYLKIGVNCGCIIFWDFGFIKCKSEIIIQAMSYASI